MLAAIAACGPDDQTPSSPARALAGIPVREGATSPPGTPLGGGFSVADGAHLVGTVFPNELDDGWRAVLLLTDDVGAVLESYRQQAAAAGLPFRAPPRCEETDDTLTCGARGTSADGRRALEVAVWRGRVGSDGTPVSHAHLDFSEPKAPTPPTDAPLTAPIVVASPPLPTGWELPGVEIVSRPGHPTWAWVTVSRAF